MDERTRLYTTRSPGWEPNIGADGRIQVSINYYHEGVGRYCSDSVHLPRYIELFGKGLLKWQREGTPQPEHNPGLPEAEQHLEAEEAYRGDAALQPCGWRTERDRQPPSVGHGRLGRKASVLIGNIGAGESSLLDEEEERQEEELPPEVLAIDEPEEDVEAEQQAAAQVLHSRYSTTIQELSRSFGWSALKPESRLGILAKKMGVEASAVSAYLAQHRPLQQLLNK